MLAAERSEFEQMVRVLCAGFNVPATAERIEAYWRGCNRMSLLTFGRVVDHALEEFESDRNGPPTVPQMWGLFRDLRERAPAPEQISEPLDPLQKFAGLLMFSFWLRKAYPDNNGRGRTASDASTRATVKARSRIVAACRGDAVLTRALSKDSTMRSPEEASAVNELRDVLLNAFEKNWEPRPEAEIIADLAHFARTGRMRDTTAGVCNVTA